MQKSFSNTRDKKKQQQSSSTRIVKPKVKTGRTSSAFNSVSLEPVIDIHKGQSALDLFQNGLTSQSAHSGAIDVSLLAKRCLNISTANIDPEEIINRLNEVTHIRLDREHITKIDNLELFGSKIRNLYLQHNSISVIEGLDTLIGLRFLTLSHNGITKVENLGCLKQIGLLDLSHNKIDRLDVSELPSTLSVLSLEGNECQHQIEYKPSILSRCPQLCQLDNERLTAEEKRSAGYDITSESEESDQEEGADYNFQKPFDADVLGVFDDLSANLFLRCQSRIQQVFNDHEERMGNLDRIKTAGNIHIDERVSTSNSRFSSRLNSPDTTDSSRPPTGSTCMSHRSADAADNE